MNIHNASLTISAVAPAQYPAAAFPDIAFAGRSNVGKSSFINKILNRKNLARTSSTPGKTATINFYNIDDALYLVDLPGYGYANVSHTEREKWGKMINAYLSKRASLKTTALLVDARHKPTKDDLTMLSWIRAKHGSALVIATKCDKLAGTKLNEHLETVYSTLALTEDDVFIPFSAQTGLGVKDAWAALCAAANIDTLVGLQ